MAGTRQSVRAVSGTSRREGNQPRRKTRNPRRWRYWRRHTPHFYLVLLAVSCALLACGTTVVAYVGGGLTLGAVAVVTVGIATLTVSVAYFWGFFLLLSGQVPAHRFRVLLPHACVGTLSPLAFMLNFSLALDGLGRRPVSLWLAGLMSASVGLLGVQFAMGRAVVHRPRPHVVAAGIEGPSRTEPRRTRIVMALSRIRWWW